MAPKKPKQNKPPKTVNQGSKQAETAGSTAGASNKSSKAATAKVPTVKPGPAQRALAFEKWFPSYLTGPDTSGIVRDQPDYNERTWRPTPEEVAKVPVTLKTVLGVMQIKQKYRNYVVMYKTGTSYGIISADKELCEEVFEKHGLKQKKDFGKILGYMVGESKAVDFIDDVLDGGSKVVVRLIDEGVETINAYTPGLAPDYTRKEDASTMVAVASTKRENGNYDIALFYFITRQGSIALKLLENQNNHVAMQRLISHAMPNEIVVASSCARETWEVLQSENNNRRPLVKQSSADMLTDAMLNKIIHDLPACVVGKTQAFKLDDITAAAAATAADAEAAVNAEEAAVPNVGNSKIQRTVLNSLVQRAAVNALVWYLGHLSFTSSLSQETLTNLKNWPEYANRVYIPSSCAQDLNLADNIDNARSGTLLGCIGNPSFKSASNVLKEWVLHPFTQPHEIKRQQKLYQLVEDDVMLHALEGVLKCTDPAKLHSRLLAGTLKPADVVKELPAMIDGYLEIVNLISKVAQVQEHPELFNRVLERYNTVGKTLTEARVICSKQAIDGGKKLLSPVRPSQAIEWKEASAAELHSRNALEAIPLNIEAGYRIKVKLAPGLAGLQGYLLRNSQSAQLSELDRTEIAYREEVHECVKYWSFDASRQAATKLASCVSEFKLAKEKYTNEVHRQLLMQESFILCAAREIAEIFAIKQVAGFCKRLQAEGVDMCMPVIEASGYGGAVSVSGLRYACTLGDKKVARIKPNSLELAPGKKNVILLTGANGTGKSTLAKALVIAIVLAQLGSAVPCSSMKLSPFHKIFSRMGARDDITRGLSTFKMELRDASIALSMTGPNTLIVFDEVGRGTDATSGFIVGAATLDEFLTSGTRGIWITHHDGMKFAFKDDARLTPLYTDKFVIIKGVARASQAILVAERHGLPASIIDEANAYLEENPTDESSLTAQANTLLIKDVARFHHDLLWPASPEDANQYAQLPKPLTEADLAIFRAMTARTYRILQKVCPDDA